MKANTWPLFTVSSDDTDGLEGRITHRVVNEGLYRLHIALLGDGAGGDFHLALKETKLSWSTSSVGTVSVEGGRSSRQVPMSYPFRFCRGSIFWHPGFRGIRWAKS